MSDLHFEPFVHLAGLDDDQALIAWGGFWFRPFEDGQGWRTVDDEELPGIEPGRTDSIGVRSQPYGEAVVEVFGPDGSLAGRATTRERNHVWITGLDAATEYRYEVTVDGEPWLPEQLKSWRRIDAERGELVDASHRYDCRFRTFPTQGDAERIRFAAIGDYGVGIQTGSTSGSHQADVAELLRLLVDGEDTAGSTRPGAGLDLVITLGDNIYHQEGEGAGGSGSEDDDWYFSFYEPYRWVLARVPVYPAVGNHDAGETEDSDDRDQLADNHFTDLRFQPDVEADRASVTVEDDRTSGLFYRFSFGRLVEFVAVDTSEAADFAHDRYFDQPVHRDFLETCFDPARDDRGHWIVPFAHHPPYCAGPKHHNDEDQLASLLPLYRRAGVRLVLAGHEHNFQHGFHDDMHFFVSGASGKLREGEPDRFDDAHIRSWAARAHLLLIEADRETLSVLPVEGVDDGELRPIEATAPDGSRAHFPVVIECN